MPITSLLDYSKCVYYTDEGWVYYTHHVIMSLRGGSAEFSLLAQVLSLTEGGEGEEQVKCICVNPGRLAKGEGGGTFAELNYCGGPDTTYASIVSI